jgi:hypothetical protein
MKSLQTLILCVVGAAAVLAAVLTSWAARAPRARAARAERLVAATPAVVESIIADVDAQPRWRSDVARVERRADGSFSEWDTRGRETRFVPTSAPGGVALTFTGQGFRGEFRATLTPEGQATRVRVEESITLDSAASALLSSLFFDLDAFVARWLDELDRESARRAASAGAAAADAPAGAPLGARPGEG